MIDFIPCRECANSAIPGYKEVVIEVKGTPYKALQKCKCKEEYQQKLNLYINLERANLRPSMLDYELDKDYKGTKSLESVRKVAQYAQGITGNYKHQSIYLWGPYGTQKTTVAQWIGKEVVKQDVKPYYVLMRTLTNALVEDQYDRADEHEDSKARRKRLLTSARNADLLILDESFDLAKMTVYKSNYQIPFLDEFIRHRIDMQEKPVVFVSNVSIQNIDPAFAAIRDMLKRRISAVKGELKFEDNFEEVMNDFDIGDIFKV